MNKGSNRSKYWIHKIDKDILRQLHDEKILGSKSKRSRLIKNIEANDKIILFTTLNLNNGKNISFIAYTMVDEVFENNKPLYDYYNSSKKLKLKGMKYFTNPIAAKDLAKSFKFIKDDKNPANFLKSEYKEISKADFNKILNRSSLSMEYPAYFEKMSFTVDEFLLNAIKGLYDLLRKNEKRNQIEIKTFIALLNVFLQPYEISKSHSEIGEFYSKNAWKLDLKHEPSRDPDNSIFLYNSQGKKRKFGYISLN